MWRSTAPTHDGWRSFTPNSPACRSPTTATTGYCSPGTTRPTVWRSSKHRITGCRADPTPLIPNSSTSTSWSTTWTVRAIRCSRSAHPTWTVTCTPSRPASRSASSRCQTGPTRSTRHPLSCDRWPRLSRNLSCCRAGLGMAVLGLIAVNVRQACSSVPRAVSTPVGAGSWSRPRSTRPVWVWRISTARNTYCLLRVK